MLLRCSAFPDSPADLGCSLMLYLALVGVNGFEIAHSPCSGFDRECSGYDEEWVASQAAAANLRDI